MTGDHSSSSRRVVVTFRGGPCEGTVVLGDGKTSQHTTAAMAYRPYRDSPSSIIGCHIWDGLCESEEPADYYTVVDATEADGTLNLICEYGGQKAE